MGADQALIPTITNWSLLQLQLNEALRVMGAFQPIAAYALPTDPIDGQIVILRPLQIWYQWQPPSWVIVG